MFNCGQIVCDKDGDVGWCIVLVDTDPIWRVQCHLNKCLSDTVEI